MGEKLKIFLRFEFGGEFARRVVDEGHEVSFPARRHGAKPSLPNIITRPSVFAKCRGSLNLARAERCDAEREGRRRGQPSAVANSIAFQRIVAAPASRIRPLPDLSGANTRNTSLVGAR